MTVRWAKYHGPMDNDECQRILKSDLGKIGDTVLVWVNEGDLCSLGKEMRPRTPGEIMRDALQYVIKTDRTLNVSVGGGAYMTLPRPEWLWQLCHIRQEPNRWTKCDDRMLVVGVLESYLYLIEDCSRDEAWRRIKLLRAAMRGVRSDGQAEDR